MINCTALVQTVTVQISLCVLYWCFCCCCFLRPLCSCSNQKCNKANFHLFPVQTKDYIQYKRTECRTETTIVQMVVALYTVERLCVCVYTVSSHFGTSLAVGAVVQIHRQPARLDMSLHLHLPVVNQRGGTDDQSAFRSHGAGIWTVNKHKEIETRRLNT